MRLTNIFCSDTELGALAVSIEEEGLRVRKALLTDEFTKRLMITFRAKELNPLFERGEEVFITFDQLEDTSEEDYSCLFDNKGCTNTKGEDREPTPHPLAARHIEALCFSVDDLRSTAYDSGDLSELCDPCGGKCCTEAIVNGGHYVVDLSPIEEGLATKTERVSIEDERIRHRRSFEFSIEDTIMLMLFDSTGKHCEHLTPDSKCGVWDNRPLGCAQFTCFSPYGGGLPSFVFPKTGAKPRAEQLERVRRINDTARDGREAKIEKLLASRVDPEGLAVIAWLRRQRGAL